MVDVIVDEVFPRTRILNCTSGNCVYTTHNNTFYKFEARQQNGVSVASVATDAADPLCVEVLNLLMLAQTEQQVVNNNQSIFLEYVNHFQVELSSQHRAVRAGRSFNLVQGAYNVLATKEMTCKSSSDHMDTLIETYEKLLISGNSKDFYYQNPTILYADAVIKATWHYVCDVIILLKRYMQVASAIHFVHNDLHYSNLVWRLDHFEDKPSGGFVIIDYGRSLFDIKKANGDIMGMVCHGFSIEKDELLQNIEIIRKKPYVIQPSQYAYMCDVAQVAILTSLLNRGWLLQATDNNGKPLIPFIEYIIDDKPKDDKEPNEGEKKIKERNDKIVFNYEKLLERQQNGKLTYLVNGITKGLAFIAIYLRALKMELQNSKDSYTLTLLNTNEKSDNFDQKYLLNGILLSNGMINPFIYNNIRHTVEKAWEDYLKNINNYDSNTPAVKRARHGGGEDEDFTLDQMNSLTNKNTGITKEIFTERNRFIFNKITPYPGHKGSGSTKPTKLQRQQTQYKIHVERDTKRRYVLVNKHKRYLDEQRGRFRYTDDSKKTIVFRGKQAKF